MNHESSGSVAVISTRALALAAALCSSSGAAAAAEDDWSVNLTPVLILPEDGYSLGGGLDPEVKYSVDLDGARFGMGARFAGYYAKDTFGVMAMPTARLTVPVGDFDPYAAFGMGYGHLPETGHGDVATMARLGFVYHFSETLAIGLEGTLQQIYGSNFGFPSFGSMMAFDL